MLRFFLVCVLVACGGASVELPEAGNVDSGSDAGLVCNGGTVACGDKCVQLDFDPSNCGKCGKKCGGGEVCSAGKCGSSCPPGFTECSGICVNLQGDPQNCGACGKACSNQNGVGQCTKGACSITCVGTFANCDNDPATGCEVDLSNDGKNCGKCGHDCLGGACSSGTCQPVVLASNQGNPWAIERMDRDCESSAARYGIVLDACLITQIDPPDEVESALAAINTAYNHVSSEISLAKAAADQRIVQSKRAVEIETLRVQAEIEPLKALAAELSALEAAGPGALDAYVRNVRLGMLGRAKRVILPFGNGAKSTVPVDIPPNTLRQGGRP
jgi:hypothetical protein